MSATPTTTATTAADALTAFHWTPQSAAFALVKEIVADFLGRNAYAAKLAGRMRAETGTRFIDWIDHLSLPKEAEIAARLAGAGFTARGDLFVQEGGIFPNFFLRKQAETKVAIKVESVVDFLVANDLRRTPIIGSPYGMVRRARVAVENQAELWVVERHGAEADGPGLDIPTVLRHLEAFRLRQRLFDDEREGLAATGKLIDAAVSDLGDGYAADLFFAAEREYWQRRNRAARAQKARQDRLGLGWANHDHHTYRSSRLHFAPMIALFEKLGLKCRERFYAGADAGWGAQVMEHPTAGFVVFADVDLSPEELRGDFPHLGLESRKALGTVGLWCALHGEAILEAGMHHLECQFDFLELTEQLEKEEQVKVMKPFTEFPYLRQAFTEGEMWPVRERRIAPLLAAGQITEAQAEQFRRQGALGSHLENLERNDGFKGFNQKGVSDIIARTDPRGAAR
jgi:hypothetical protein